MQDYRSEERFQPEEGQGHPEEKEERRGEEGRGGKRRKRGQGLRTAEN